MNFQDWLLKQEWVKKLDYDGLDPVAQQTIADAVLTLEFAWESGYISGYEDCVREIPKDGGGSV